MVQLRWENDESGILSLWLTNTDVPITATHECVSRGLRGKIWLDFDENNRFVRIRLRDAGLLVCPPEELEWEADVIEATDHAYIALGRRGGPLGQGGGRTYEVLDEPFMDGIRLDFDKKRRLTGIEAESASRLLPRD